MSVLSKIVLFPRKGLGVPYFTWTILSDICFILNSGGEICKMKRKSYFTQPVSQASLKLRCLSE